MPQNGAGKNATRRSAQVEHVTRAILRLTGEAEDPLFEAVEDQGGSFLCLTAAPGWLFADRTVRLECLERVFDLWAQVERRPFVIVRVIDREGRLLMEERRV